jgi:hypothetical protein
MKYMNLMIIVLNGIIYLVDAFTNVKISVKPHKEFPLYYVK